MPATKYTEATVWNRQAGDMREQVVFPAESREDMLIVHRDPHSLFSDHAVRMAGISQFPSGYYVERQNSEDHLILFSLDGGLELQGKRPRKLKCGEMLVAPAGSRYSYRSRSMCRILWFHFTHHPHWDRLLQQRVEVRQSRYMREIEMLAQAHLAESDRLQIDSNRFCLGYENLMMGYLERELARSHTTIELETLERLERLWMKVAEEPGHDWTLAELAKIAGYSESSLHRLTQKLQQTTPLGIVRKTRMERAANLLLRSASTLEVISHEVGYANAFTFSRAFKKHFGVSPERFRGRFIKKHVRSRRARPPSGSGR